MRTNTLITGASSGLGAGMAGHLAASGHHPDITVSVHALDVNDHDAVFEVFGQAAEALGGLDRVIVNAGLGKGGRIGTGRFAANRETAMTNFVAALAQCEAAMEHFYERRGGHLVVISSLSAMRGMPSSMTTYAATKAGVALLAEGIRSDLLTRKDLDIAVTTLFPGYIASEMSDQAEQAQRLMVDTETGTAAMVKLIEKEVATAAVPRWPWAPIGQVLKHAPLSVVRRMV